MTEQTSALARTAVVIPAYRSRDHILDVLDAVPADIPAIFVVDDACPNATGSHVALNTDDPRVKVITLPDNLGVGGATLAGFTAAFKAGYDVAVKIDSDGQIDPRLASAVVESFEQRGVQFVKGSRFTTPKNLVGMPRHRVVLNAILSITNKLASGYYSLSDPTNGLIALHRSAFDQIDVTKIAQRFFFESDLQHHLNLARIPAAQIPMRAIYADEVSNLRMTREVLSFMWGTARNFVKRVFMRHFVLSFSLGGVYLVLGALFSGFALIFGVSSWVASATSGIPSNAGTVAITTLSALIGVNFLSTFLVFDVNDEP